MKGWRSAVVASMHAEITPRRLRLAADGHGLELELERAPSGRLTEDCRARITEQLRAFVQQHAPAGPRRVWCALPARGVSLRRLKLPAAPPEQLRSLLRLQIEREFPLPPDQLAWGWRALEPESDGAARSANATLEVVVAAVKRDLIEDYAQVFAACGLEPVFTLAAWVRSRCVQPSDRRFAMLEVGDGQAELAVFEDGALTGLRVLPWDAGRLSNALATELQTRALPGRLYLGGPPDLLPPGAEAALQAALGDGVSCHRVEVPSGSGASTTLVALQRCAADRTGSPPLTLSWGGEETGVRTVRREEIRRYAVLAGVLALAALVLRYAPPLIRYGPLEQRLAAARADQARWRNLDPTLAFLRFLETNQPPCLELIETLAAASPRGTQVESLSLNRRGAMVLRATLPNPDAVNQLRSKLLASGWFASVVVEEQAEDPNRRTVKLRLSAQWQRQAAGPPKEEP